MSDDRMDGKPTGTSPGTADALSVAATRLALRQLNQRTLLPVLLHEVNGGLNGLALSAELLSRLLPSAASQSEAASGLMQRTRSELARLKQSIKDLELRLAPSDGDPAPASLVAVTRDVQELLTPAMRRSQLEWRAPGSDDAPATLAPQVSGADLAYQLVLGQAIVAIESAAPGARLSVDVGQEGSNGTVSIEREGPARSSLALEVHRELLRRAAALAGGQITWQGANSRLALHRVDG